MMKDVTSKGEINLEIMSMVNMLAITKLCNLHPYTIAESDEMYSTIINQQLDLTDIAGKDTGNYAYSGLLGALLAEKLLNQKELQSIQHVDLKQFSNIVASQKNFYAQFLSEITQGGSMNASLNIEKLKTQIEKAIDEREKNLMKSILNIAAQSGGISGGGIALAATVTAVSAPLQVVGALLALSSSFSGMLSPSNNSEQPIISVFKELQKNA